LKSNLIIVVFATIAYVQTACAAGIADVRWSSSNLETLHGFDKSAVENFVNHLTGEDPLRAKVGGYGWYDLQGTGQYRLVVTEDLSGRAFFYYLAIYGQDAAGEAHLEQWVEGAEIGTDLKKVVRDLNGNGTDELVIHKTLISYSTAETFTWPTVYRFDNGKYVEASREFPDFYDDEVLPGIDRDIAALRSHPPGANVNQVPLVVLEMERDKIERVLDRNPTAGLQDAYGWMNSRDPKVLQAAAATLQDIGGHEAEERAAEQARQRALCVQFPRVATCKKGLPVSAAR
jgi:hypothetical protein